MLDHHDHKPQWRLWIPIVINIAIIIAVCAIVKTHPHYDKDTKVISIFAAFAVAFIITIVSSDHLDED